jgi:hypothetical protein
MRVLRSVLVIALAALTAGDQQSFAQQLWTPAKPVPASCHMTHRPATAFVPPPEYHPEELSADEFFIGTEKLWTSLLDPMMWGWSPHRPGHEQDLTAKIFWGRVGYSWRTEPRPRIKVTGRRLDGPAPPLMLPQGSATHAIIDDSGRGAMLTGVYVPVPGCWEITGDYDGDKVSFVVWVVPEKRK